MTRAQELSEALLSAGLELSRQAQGTDITDELLARRAGLSADDFRRVFGDLEAYIHTLQLRLTGDLDAALRKALLTSGSRREKLERAAITYLDLCLEHRGAHAWVGELSLRCAPLDASRGKHGRQLARVLEQELCTAWPALALAESRLLMAALRDLAAREGQRGLALTADREAIGELIRVCTEEEDWPESPSGAQPPASLH